jgi:hypothetical protein
MIRNYRLGKLALATTGGGELRALIDAELEPKPGADVVADQLETRVA